MEVDKPEEESTSGRPQSQQYLLMGTGVVGLILIAIAILISTAGAGSENPLATYTRVHFLHMNDAHGHLEAEDLKLDLAGLGIPQDSLSNVQENAALYIKYGGYPMVSQALVDREAALKKGNTNEPVFKFHAGDALTGTLWYALLNSEVDAALMRKVCFDTFTPGNHEFDDGDANLALFLDRLNNVSDGECAPAILGANINPGPNSPLIGSFEKHKIIDRGGVKLGVIGVGTKVKTMEASSPDPGTTLEDEKTAAQREIDALTAKGIKHIVLISHIGYNNDLRLAQELQGIDVIIGGDSHSLLSSDQPTIDFLRGSKVADYPVKKGNVCVVQSWEYTHVLGELSVTFDEDGVVQSCTGKPFVPLERDSLYQKYKVNDTNMQDPLVPADNEEVYKKIVPIEGAMFIDTTQAFYKDVKAVLDSYAPIIESKRNQEVGTVVRNLVQRQLPGATAATYKHGCEVAPVVGRVFTLQMSKADLAIVNAGSIRQSFNAGPLTYDGLVQTLPFFDTLVEIDLTGATLKEAMTAALKRVQGNTDYSASFPYAWGLRYDIDMTEDEPLSNVQVNSRLEGTWVALENEKRYKIVTTAFLARGQDGYVPFGEIPEEDKLDTGDTDVQTMMSYLQKQDLAPVADEDRPVRKFINADGCDHSTGSTGDCATRFGEEGHLAIVV